MDAIISIKMQSVGGWFDGQARFHLNWQWNIVYLLLYDYFMTETKQWMDKTWTVDSQKQNFIQECK